MALTASAGTTPAHASTFLTLTNQSIVAADLTQTNRLDGGSPTTGCTGPPAVMATNDGSVLHFDRYPLVNQTDQPQCVTVSVTPTNCMGAIQSATYASSFDPGAVTANVIGESGSPAGGPYEVLVGAGQPFVVVVNETTANGFCGGYGITLTSVLPWAISAPSSSGGAVTGETLTATSNWGTTPAPTTITRQWRRCDAAGANCSDIPGAVDATYVPTDADLGSTLRVFEAATDPSGTSTSMGPPTTPVQSGRPRPAYTRASGTVSLERGTTLVAGSQGDDVVVDFPLPFPVSFYGNEYTSAKLGINGVVQFESANATPLNAALPTSRLGPAIAAHWDDLVTTGAGEGIFTSVTGDAPNRVLHIEWRASLFPGGGAYPGTDPVNFEIRLTEDSPAFSIVYGTVAKFGSTATVGVQAAPAAPFADQFSFNTASVPAGLHLEYTSSRPSIAGTPSEGSELTGSDASWIGPGSIATALQWMDCDAQGTSCTEIPGATGASFVPGAAQVGRRLRLRATATNTRGSTSVLSSPTSPVESKAGGPGSDRTMPVIRSLRLSNTTFRVARGVTPISAAAKRGTNIRSTVSEAGTGRYTVQRELSGRLVGKTCRKPSRKLRKRKACKRYRTQETLLRGVKAGANTFFFNGRIRSLALTPARYRVVMRVTDAAGNVSQNRWARFRIVSR